MSNAAELKVLSSLAIKEAYLELLPQFERDSGRQVTTVWTGTVDIMKRMAAGEIFDLVIIATPSLEELVKQGKLVPGVDLVKSGVGIAVPAGAAKPDVSSSDALKKALLAAKSVGYSTGPSGVYLAGVFTRMGIADDIAPKVKQVPTGGSVGTLLASGEVELGFQQQSELIHFPGVDYVGPLPPEIQNITVFAGGIHAKANDPEGAKALVNLLTGPTAIPVIKKHGLEPG
jgi:molybdate transport system substrate-binding protein